MIENPQLQDEDRARRYARTRRLLRLTDFGVTLAVLLALLFAGWSAALRDGAQSITESPVAALALYFLGLTALLQALTFPLDAYSGFALEHRYHLSNQTAGAWLRDWLKGLALSFAFGLLGVEVIYLLLRWLPDLWWLAAATVFVLFFILLAQLAPVLLLPIFYKFEPLADEDLKRRLLKLSERVGARVRGVFLWKLSEKSKKANAALTGWGATRRIILSDTLVAGHSPEEIEVVLAHELGHHVAGGHLARDPAAKRADLRWLLPGAPCAFGLEPRARVRRPRRLRQPAAAAADRYGPVAAGAAVRQCPIPPARTRRRPLRPRDHRPARTLHRRNGKTRRAESGAAAAASADRVRVSLAPLGGKARRLCPRVEGIAKRKIHVHRPHPVIIVGSSHQPPEAKSVPSLVEEMCDYMNENWGASPIHLAAYLLWRMNWVHPFSDGNGRTARALSYARLCIRLGYRLPGARTIPEQISADKSPYYKALESADEAWSEERVDVGDLEDMLGAMLAVQLVEVHREATGSQG